MSKAGKVLIGAAAIAGGAYYYDQNIHPIFPTQKEVNQDLTKVDNKQKEVSKKFSSKIDEAKSKVQKTPSITEQVKESNLYQKVASVVDSTSSDAEKRANSLLKDDKNVLFKAADQYIDSINRLAGGKQYNEVTGKIESVANDVAARAKEEKNAWNGWFSSKKDEVNSSAKDLQKEAESKKNEWFSWGDKKAEEARKKAEKEKDSWFSWGQKKSDEAKNQFDAASKDAEVKKNEWINWGSSKKDEAQKNINSAISDSEAKKDEWVNWSLKKAEETQDSLSKSYDSVVSESEKQIKKFDAQVNSAYQEGKANAIKGYESAKNSLDDLLSYTQPDKEAKLKQAKTDFNNSLANLRSYGEDVVGETNDRLQKALGKR